jgi:predicted CopG family antitoxin
VSCTRFPRIDEAQGRHSCRRRLAHPEIIPSKPCLTLEYVYYTYMVKKLTITVSDDVYEGLHRRIGRRKISRFIDELARESLRPRALADEYAQATQDEAAEREALEWIEAGVGETLDDEDFVEPSGRPPR